MKKWTVEYSGGESVVEPGTSVDYMMVTVENDDEEFRLYAELSLLDLEDENGEKILIEDEETGESDFNPEVSDPERASFPYLRKAICELCEEVGVDAEEIDFRENGAPTYMDDYVYPYKKIR